MIFDLTKSYVPEAYTDSRDYRVFLKQLSILLSVLKHNIDHFPDLYSPDKCQDHMLPLLASLVGSKYFEGKSVESNRKIVKYFPYLLRNRGSTTGMRLAVALSVNTSPGVERNFSSENVILEVDVRKGLITVYYPDIDNVDMSLVEVVRPVGMRIKFVRSDISTWSEELDLVTSASAESRDQYYDESTVGESQVGFTVNRKIREEESEES